MALYFQYGQYQHEPGDIVIASISRATEYSPRGQPLLSKLTWSIQGQIHADSPALLTPKLRALEAAYARHGRDAGLYETGGVPTAHVMRSAGSIGGVRSSGVQYPTGDGIEYTTLRNYSVTLEADYPFEDVSLLEFSETLSFSGTCRPRFVFLPLLNGQPEKQIVQRSTTQKVTQSGNALGYFSRPSAPPPLWPNDEHEDLRQISTTSPRVVYGRTVDFGIQWSYSFESSTPLIGEPRTQ